MCAEKEESVCPVNEKTVASREAKKCAGKECRHRQTLKYITENAGKIYHDMSQPIMVIQGYLELIELGKYGTDDENMKQILGTVTEQLQKMQKIQGRLKGVLRHNRLQTVE